MFFSKVQKPSKKIIILGSVALVTILTLSYLKFFGKDLKKENLVNVSYTATSTESSENILSDISSIDTDKDGLPDWQEALQGTNPKKSDTDGDGVSDGEEIKLGRDPLKAGPDDRITNIFATSTDAKTAEDYAPKTVSEGIARNLFANAVYLSNSDSVTEENKNAVVDGLVNELQGAFNYKEYTLGDLSLISNENPDTLRFYGSSFAAFQIRMILEMQNNAPAIEGNIGVMSKIYTDEARNLASLKVPASLLSTHLQIVNNYSKSASVFDAIANEKKDPLKLPLAIRVYKDAVDSQTILLTDIAQYLKDNDIIFATDEVGSYWNAFNN